MIIKIDKRSNLFNHDTLKESPVLIVGYNCLFPYKEAQFKEMLFCFKGDKNFSVTLKSILYLFGKYPQRISFVVSSKKFGKTFFVCKPFFKNVVIEKIGDFERTNQIFYKDQVEFFKNEFEKHNFSKEKRILVDLSSLVSFDQTEENGFVNFFASIPHKVELFY